MRGNVLGSRIDCACTCTRHEAQMPLLEDILSTLCEDGCRVLGGNAIDRIETFQRVPPIAAESWQTADLNCALTGLHERADIRTIAPNSA